MTLGPWREALLSATLVVLALGCRPGAVDPRSNGVPTRPNYRSVLSEWTRDGEAYLALGGRLFVSATWLSPAFLQAQVAARAGTEDYSVAEADAAQRDALTPRNEVVFVLGVNTPEWGWNHLEAPEDTAVFRLRLRNLRDGGHGATALEVAPLKVERLETQPKFALLYPFITPLHIGYRVVFPENVGGVSVVPGPGGVLRLVVAGPPGSVALDWAIRG